jgi:hypothetical protein
LSNVRHGSGHYKTVVALSLISLFIEYKVDPIFSNANGALEMELLHSAEQFRGFARKGEFEIVWLNNHRMDVPNCQKRGS